MRSLLLHFFLAFNQKAVFARESFSIASFIVILLTLTSEALNSRDRDLKLKSHENSEQRICSGLDSCFELQHKS